MFYKLIVAYLIGIVVAANFLTDMSFIVMSFMVSLMSFIIYYKYKGHLINLQILKFFIPIFICFVLGIGYTIYRDDSVSYISYTGREYLIEGSVVEVKQQNISRTLTLEVSKMSDLETNTLEKEYPRYLTLNVSSLNKNQLFDHLEVVGEIGYINSTFRSEKLFYNPKYNVTQIRKISNLSYTKNMYEKLTIAFHNFCESLIERISTHMPEPYGSIAQGISLGEQDNLQKDVKDIFKTSGLIHILVLSGANVSFIISIFWYAISRKKLNLKVSSKILATLFFAWTFILGTGLTPPSIRAGVMSSVNIFTEYFSKNISTIQSLLYSLFILTLVNPLSLIYSPSLHLSFLACIGLFILTPKLEYIFGIKIKFLSFMCASFVGLFLTTTPYILYMSGSTSLFGTLLTFIVEPFIVLTTTLSFLIILSSFINFYLADFFGILNSLTVKFIFNVAKFGSDYLPLINFQISKPTLIIFYILTTIIFWNVQHDIILEKEAQESSPEKTV